MNHAPHRTDAQRAEALEKGNRIRTARKELKVLLRADRELEVARSIIADPDRAALELGRRLEPVLGYQPPADWLDSLAVATVLLNCPKIGTVKAQRIMRAAWGHLTTTTRRVGGMTHHHRLTLAAELGAQAARANRFERTAA